MGETVSLFGDQITLIALPLVGVFSLHASDAQMGFLQSKRKHALALVTMPERGWFISCAMLAVTIVSRFVRSRDARPRAFGIVAGTRRHLALAGDTSCRAALTPRSLKRRADASTRESSDPTKLSNDAPAFRR